MAARGTLSMPTPSLILTIRFAASHPDLTLSARDPLHTAVLALHAPIRAALPSPYAAARLRLIAGGRVLDPDLSLTDALRLPWHDTYQQQLDHKVLDPGVFETSDGLYEDWSSAALVVAVADVKGKSPARNQDHTPSSTSNAQQPIYIHASFTNEEPLSQSEIDAEAARIVHLNAALREPPASISTSANATDNGSPLNPLHASPSQWRRPSPLQASSSRASASRVSDNQNTSSATLSSPPASARHGFDRLLSAGLSATEVAALRSQFVAILAHTRTPDTMPSAPELRALEEHWLDNDASQGSSMVPAGPNVADGTGGEAAVTADGTNGVGFTTASEEEGVALDDMLWGSVAGFFWPNGAVVWLLREEGIWTPRRQLAVLTGLLINLAFSLMRVAG